MADRLLPEILERLRLPGAVGVGYLSLDRPTTTLSGGEAHRIRLAGQIGARMQGILYVLDEPSVGLHPRDNERLLDTLTAIRDLGNTVVVVEHDEQTIRAADYVVDLGEGAGRQRRAPDVPGSAGFPQRQPHRPLPARRAAHPGAGAAPRGARASCASWARASTTCATSTSRSRWAC